MAGRSILAGVVAIGCLAGVALAQAPDRSPRPMPRPAQAAGVAEVVPTAAPLVATGLRPRARPFAPVAQVAAALEPAPVAQSAPTIRPRARPFVAAAPVAVAAVAVVPQPAARAFVNGLDRSARPRARPGLPAQAPEPQAEPQAEAVQTAAATTAAPAPRKGGFFGLFAPRQRPEAGQEGEVEDAAIRIQPGREAVVSKKGSVCGVNAIKGEKLAPIPSKTQGCGIDEPVRVTSVGGIALSTPATINCDTAIAMNRWVKEAVEPVYGKGKVVELKIAASYACRPRNNIRGARISEHGRGNAIDIAGLTLSNGKTYMVRGDFDKKMRQVHQAACGIFGTTLGPGSDGYHEDHMHFDVAAYRNGPYCR